MAQDVMRRFPDKVFEGPDGLLRIRLDNLPAGITAFDLYQPVHPAGYSAALERWRRVLTHWSRKDKTA
jgi:rhamnogalacturonyl hydrolase YesR